MAATPAAGGVPPTRISWLQPRSRRGTAHQNIMAATPQQAGYRPPEYHGCNPAAGGVPPTRISWLPPRSRRGTAHQDDGEKIFLPRQPMMISIRYINTKELPKPSAFRRQ